MKNGTRSYEVNQNNEKLFTELSLDLKSFLKERTFKKTSFTRSFWQTVFSPLFQEEARPCSSSLRSPTSLTSYRTTSSLRSMVKKSSRKPRDERNLKDQARGTCEELRVQRHHPRICKSEDTSVVSKEERWFKKEAGKWVNGCSTRHLRNIRIYRGSWRSPTSTSPLRRDDKGISQPLDLHRISQSNKHTTYVLTKGIFDSPVRSFLRDSEGSKPPQRTGDRLQRRPQARWEVGPSSVEETALQETG